MWDAFEAMVLPRRVTRRLRPTRYLLSRHLDGVVGGGTSHATGWASRNLPELLRPPVAPGSGGGVGGQPGNGVRPAADRPRRPAQRPGRRLVHRSSLPERHDVLHPRPRRRHAGSRAGAAADRDRGGHRVRLPGARHRLPAGALPVVLAARGRASRCWTRGPARRRAPRSCCGGRPEIGTTRDGRCCASGSAGPRSCSRATSPIRCSRYFRSQHDNQSWLAGADHDPRHLRAGDRRASTARARARRS